MNQRKRLMVWLSAISLSLLMLALAGCGGGDAATAPSKTTAAGNISTS